MTHLSIESQWLAIMDFLDEQTGENDDLIIDIT